jgi:multicomponent Na+:H+ antiporter subunit C
VEWVGIANYGSSFFLMMLGLYCVITSGNFVKKMIGMIIFQTSVLLFYISIGKVDKGLVPILVEEGKLYTNPIPHVLMLTAIVVGVAVLAVGLALCVRIKESYGTIEEEEILAMDKEL